MPCCERGVLCCLLGVVTAGPAAVPPPHGALTGVTSACGYPKNGWQLRAGQGRVPGRWCCFLLPPRAARCTQGAVGLRCLCWELFPAGAVESRVGLCWEPPPHRGARCGAWGAPGSATDQTFSSFFFLWCWDPARKREGERMAQLRTASWARVPWMTSSTCPPNSASRPVPGRPGCPLPPPRPGPSARRATQGSGLRPRHLPAGRSWGARGPAPRRGWGPRLQG